MGSYVTPCGFVTTDVSEEHIVSIIRVARIGEYFFAAFFGC
jgi:hypothetical protein